MVETNWREIVEYVRRIVGYVTRSLDDDINSKRLTRDYAPDNIDRYLRAINTFAEAEKMVKLGIRRDHQLLRRQMQRYMCIECQHSYCMSEGNKSTCPNCKRDDPFMLGPVTDPDLYKIPTDDEYRAEKKFAKKTTWLPKVQVWLTPAQIEKLMELVE